MTLFLNDCYLWIWTYVQLRRAETCILLYYMASAVEFSTTKVGCSTFKALWLLSIGPALGMCLFTKISYQNNAPAGWVNKNHQLKPYSKAIYTLPHVCIILFSFISKNKFFQNETIFSYYQISSTIRNSFVRFIFNLHHSSFISSCPYPSS